MDWQSTAPHDERLLSTFLAGRRTQMESDLASLVEQNSFTGNREGGLAVGAQIEAIANENELLQTLRIQRHPSVRYADHLSFQTDGAPQTLLIGHLDTVFPPGTFEGYRVDGDLRRGPGVLDMKGGLVVVLHALRAVLEVRGVLPSVGVVIVADEEVGSPEGATIIQTLASKAECALVFESGRDQDQIVTQRKGTGLLAVFAHGKAAHAGNAHADGINAIWAIAKLVDRVQLLTDYRRGITLNVGVIAGGTTKNTVPEAARAEIDFRFVTLADGELILRDISGILADISRELPGVSFTLEGGIARPPLQRSPASIQLLTHYARAARSVGLGVEEAPLQGGGSDACTTSALGIASIDGLGPRGKGFHTRGEFIEIDTLIPKTEALARCLLSVAIHGDRRNLGASG